MKQLTIISGKGGTGKTSLTAAFTVLAKNIVVADCDVDAPDLHMLLNPKILKKQKFEGSKLAIIDQTKCTKCKLCQEKCPFEAITSNIQVDSISCEGCGVCSVVCPQKAIQLKPKTSGYSYISKIKYGYMTHALLNPGESNSGKLVSQVRQSAKDIAKKHNLSLILIDGSPGIGCPVIASISQINAALIVTEPTLSGISDLKRAYELLEHFQIPASVCINMYNINPKNTKTIENICKEKNINLSGKIHFDPQVTKAMVNNKTIIEYAPESKTTKEIKKIYQNIIKNIL